ncbi:MAG: neutral zinc metallopeptidase, partial [Gammaproteobacteria bacterium]|nr:neutral zinc metallopeptidase [Gammaproteobacteria bacterium]
MRWDGRRQSQNIEDRRGQGRGRMVGGGIATIVVALIVYFMGGDPTAVLQQAAQGPAGQPSGETAPYQESAAEAELRQYVAVVLADTEDTWTALFAAAGTPYEPPTLVLFSGAADTACGMGEAAMGPFYCPGDRKVYIDLVFYQELRDRLGAPGDFAQAYVIAHEVGHHVQNLLGISGKVHAARERQSELEANAASIRLELQADCLAGVWANHTQQQKQVLEPGDLEEALGAA